MHSHLPECCESPVVSNSDHRRFCAEIADGLHALAQPLSVLRSAIELISLGDGSEPHRQRYSDLSVENINRTCDLFASIQNLLAIELQAVEQTSVDFWQLLTPVIEDRRSAFLGLGVGLALSKPPSPQPLLGDADRTALALAGVIDTALSLSSRGDVVELIGGEIDGLLDLTIQNTRNHGKRLNSSHRLHLSVARASVLSQQGSYRLAEDPFCVALKFPLCGSHIRV